MLTTHVGSLIRPEPLLDCMRAKIAGKPVDDATYAGVLAAPVDELVRQQAKAGIDVVSDGECGKAISWSQYALE